MTAKQAKQSKWGLVTQTPLYGRTRVLTQAVPRRLAVSKVLVSQVVCQAVDTKGRVVGTHQPHDAGNVKATLKQEGKVRCEHSPPTPHRHLQPHHKVAPPKAGDEAGQYKAHQEGQPQVVAVLPADERVSIEV